MAQNGFVPVATAGDFKSRKIKGVRLNGRHYIVVKLDDGYACLDGLCPHAHGLLAFGQVFKRYLYCSYHQAVFNLTSGAPLPGSPTEVALRRYPVRVEGDVVYAQLTD
jgi:nitrite reductase/ring-hydroxylating ferredoxin subunit